MKKFLYPALAAILIISSCKLMPRENEPEALKYPHTDTVNVVDDYFGTKVSDPYRWLEDDTSAKTGEWVKSQQAFTADYMKKIPFRGKIRDHLKQIVNYERFSAIGKIGKHILYLKNDGLQNQAVYWIQDGLDGQPSVLIDPNGIAADGTASVGIDGFSNDKRYMSYHISRSGSDWSTQYVMDLDTLKALNDEIKWVKFGGAAWKGDGFYYSRYDEPTKGTELSGKSEFQKVFFHKLGDAQDKDALVYEDRAHPLRFHSASVTEDERFLFLYISEGTYGNEVWYKDLAKGTESFKPLFTGFAHQYQVIDNVGDKLLVYTDDGAGNARIVQVDPLNPAKPHWKDVIPEKPEKLEGVNSAGGKLFATYLKDASTRVQQLTMEGKLEHDVILPGIGTASGFGGYHDDATLMYNYSSYTTPPSLFFYDIASGKSDVFKKAVVKIPVDDYETEQVFYPSKDGTKIPMFIIHKKGLKKDGSRPTLLYGYGGFDISLTPGFSTMIYTLLENDGVYAVANLRGGGEYGQAWHDAGRLLNKQNVFDDFIAAGEWLISNKFTSKERLAVNGGSNGGLLVGAVLAQRPDLFQVALPEVGVMDMLRFQKFTVGWGWVSDYGSSDSAQYFKYLYGYSPLHNIKNGTHYPATMVFTADHDDRVVPAHSFKFAATLQQAQTGPAPALIRIETKQGHGGGSSLAKQLEKNADMYAFMFFNMGITPSFK